MSFITGLPTPLRSGLKFSFIIFLMPSNYRSLSCYPSYSLPVFNLAALCPSCFHPCVPRQCICIPPWESHLRLPYASFLHLSLVRFSRFSQAGLLLCLLVFLQAVFLQPRQTDLPVSVTQMVLMCSY